MADEPQAAESGSSGVRSVLIKIFPYLLAVALGAFGGIRVAQVKPAWFGLATGAAQQAAEVDALVKEVGKLIALPTDERPTVATVTDVEKIKDQTFFKNAQNGDKVLIYQKAGKAILYRESENRIIEVGAINFNQQGTVPTTSPTPTPTPKAKATPTATPQESPTPQQ